MHILDDVRGDLDFMRLLIEESRQYNNKELIKMTLKGYI